MPRFPDRKARDADGTLQSHYSFRPCPDRGLPIENVHWTHPMRGDDGGRACRRMLKEEGTVDADVRRKDRYGVRTFELALFLITLGESHGEPRRRDCRGPRPTLPRLSETGSLPRAGRRHSRGRLDIRRDCERPANGCCGLVRHRMRRSKNRDWKRKKPKLSLASTPTRPSNGRVRPPLISSAPAAELLRAREHVLDQPFVAYDIAQGGNLTFNAITGAVDLRLDEGPGIKLADVDLERFLTGKFQPAEVDPIEMAATSLANRSRLEHDYREVRAGLAASRGPAHVYVLSRRFLEWGSNTRLSGLSLNDEAAEARRQLQLEFEDFAAWLRLKGINDLGTSPAEIVRGTARQGHVRAPGADGEDRATQLHAQV